MSIQPTHGAQDSPADQTTSGSENDRELDRLLCSASTFQAFRRLQPVHWAADARPSIDNAASDPAHPLSPPKPVD